MDGIEITEFLEDHMAGVLGLAAGDEAYAIPVSFTYRPEDTACYFRFGYGPESRKQAFLEATDWATFVVYELGEAGWESVLVEGELTLLSEGEADTELVESINRLRIPYFDVFERPHEDLEFVIGRLAAASLTGIAEG